MVPKRLGQNKVVGNIIQFLSRNTEGLLIGGVVILMISIVVVTIACFYRAGKSTNKNTVGFHRYNQLSNSDEEDTNLSIKIDSNGVSNGYS